MGHKCHLWVEIDAQRYVIPNVSFTPLTPPEAVPNPLYVTHSRRWRAPSEPTLLTHGYSLIPIQFTHKVVVDVVAYANKLWFELEWLGQ